MLSKTQENLLKAFAGESQARNRYTEFAKKAREEGYEGIARIFEETADNERAHAEREWEFIKAEVKTLADLEISGPIGSTLENLKDAAKGEDWEAEEMYPGFSKVAREEGEEEIAVVFKEIGEVEEKHRNRYRDLIAKVEAGKVFESEEEIEWKCLNCGYVHKGTSAPGKCPACGKLKAWYEPRGINW